IEGRTNANSCARRGGGTTLIELVTYRCDAHSTSDDPAQYRADGEAQCWPGGDPVDRLRRYLISIGEWSDDAHQRLEKALEQEIFATFEHAEAYGSLADAGDQPAATLFEDVYAVLPDHLQKQRDELLAETIEDESDQAPIVPFSNTHRRVG